MIKTSLQESVTIADAISDLNNSHAKIVLILSQGGKLLGTISDGDIRRGLLIKYRFNECLYNFISE
jgi:hypothetical protein